MGDATGPLRSLVLALALAAAAGLPISAQGPPGYYFVQGPELPDSLVEISGDGRFVISVRRDAATREGARLIARAESLYPDPALIEREVATLLADPRNQRGVWEERHREAAVQPGPRWWWLVDHPWRPFAVTAGAVEHYVEAARRLRDSPDPGVFLEPGFRHTARFEYRATVTPIDAGHVVDLSMTWSHRCGRLCGRSFRHARRVMFDANGDVVEVEGDGLAEVLVY
jgi:hypothetical protein